MATTTENARMTVNRMFEEVINQRKLEVINELFVEDFVEHNDMVGDLRGREAFRQFVDGWIKGFPDIEISVSDVIVKGDLVYWTVHFSGTHTGEMPGLPPPSGKAIDIVALNKGIIRNGRGVEHWQGNDVFQLFKQLDLVPSPQ